MVPGYELICTGFLLKVVSIGCGHKHDGVGNDYADGAGTPGSGGTRVVVSSTED